MGCWWACEKLGDDPGVPKGPLSPILTVMLGVAGAVIAGFIAVATGISNGIDDFDIGSIALAVVGSMLLLAIYRLIVGGGEHRLRVTARARYSEEALLRIGSASSFR